MASSTSFPKAESAFDVSPSPAPSSSTGIFSPFKNAYARYSQWRADLGLPSPGTVESMQKEVKATHLTNFMFDGARADLTKNMSANPLFQVTHSFALGSQTATPSYNFGALFANETVFLQGGVDHDGNLNGRYNQGWNSNHVSKIQTQISSQSGHNFLQLEHDVQQPDYSVNVKAMNPWPTDLTGIYMGSYLQSITKTLAVGVEYLYHSPAPMMGELSSTYLAKYTSPTKDMIATCQLQTAGIVSATYWQKLGEKVDVAADLQLIATPERRDAVTTLGAKYDLRMSTFRAQLDSTGKVSALLEQRFGPAFVFMLSGEIDHPKNAAKVGLGVMIESTSMTPEEMAAQLPPAPPA